MLDYSIVNLLLWVREWTRPRGLIICLLGLSTDSNQICIPPCTVDYCTLIDWLTGSSFSCVLWFLRTISIGWRELVVFMYMTPYTNHLITIVFYGIRIESVSPLDEFFVLFVLQKKVKTISTLDPSCHALQYSPKMWPCYMSPAKGPTPLGLHPSSETTNDSATVYSCLCLSAEASSIQFLFSIHFTYPFTHQTI